MAELTTKILESIRDEIRGMKLDMNQRLDQTNQRLDQTNHRLDRLERRQVATEVRLATELTAVVAAIGDLNDRGC